MKNVFIIGNGFDLDLQMHTKFSDFAKDENYWPSDNSCLCNFLESKRDKEKWFDLENYLLEYVSLESNYCPPPNKINAIKQDKEFFCKLCQNLAAFIKHEQDIFIEPNDSVAKKVLKAILENGYYYSIYSFNYTNLSFLANRMGISLTSGCNHLHGSIEQGNIILGINDKNVRPDYLEFRKANSIYYNSNDIYQRLKQAHEVVVFGLSFGNIDYGYFKFFFNSLIYDLNRSERSKRWITIFTYDEKSRLEIIKSLESNGVLMSNLKSYTRFDIICTNEYHDKRKIDEFICRQIDNSKANVERKIFNSLQF